LGPEHLHHDVFLQQPVIHTPWLAGAA